MATATAVSDQQLQSEMQQVHTEATSIRKKVADDTHSLEAALSERERVIDGIALGTAKESDAPQIKAEIEKITLRIEGNNRLLKVKENRINELGREIGRRQGAVAAAARQREFVDLKKNGEAEAEAILADLTRIVAERILKLDFIRRRLAVEYPDLGGDREAARLRGMLFSHARPSDRLQEPNVHIRRLLDQGWVTAGTAGPSLQNVRSEIRGWESVPGGELTLTVCSMRPKK